MYEIAVPPDSLATIEALAVAAWPPERVELLDGWRLRCNRGVTRRGNSVSALRSDGQRALDEKLAAVERFYLSQGLPPCFHIGPADQPPELAPTLAARGYLAIAHTMTQWAALASAPLRAQIDPAHRVTLYEGFNDLWFETYCRAELIPPQDREPRQNILKRLTMPKACAVALIDQTPVATGFAVLQGAWLGVFSVATCPEFRRRGAATSALRTLAAWGRKQGAKFVYLQVLQGNAPAQSLYRRLGFANAFSYHYRELSPDAVALAHQAADLEN